MDIDLTAEYRRENNKGKKDKEETGGHGKQKDKQGEWEKKIRDNGADWVRDKNQKIRTDRRRLSNSQRQTHRFTETDKLRKQRSRADKGDSE